MSTIMDKVAPMKIFVSYSRRDAGDFADQIQKHIGSFVHYDVFTDEKILVQETFGVTP
jgi:hypothetical protein